MNMNTYVPNISAWREAQKKKEEEKKAPKIVNTIVEGGKKFEVDDSGNIYANGKVVPEENLKYVPSSIGGERVDSKPGASVKPSEPDIVTKPQPTGIEEKQSIDSTNPSNTSLYDRIAKGITSPAGTVESSSPVSFTSTVTVDEIKKVNEALESTKKAASSNRSWVDNVMPDNKPLVGSTNVGVSNPVAEVPANKIMPEKEAYAGQNPGWEWFDSILPPAPEPAIVTNPQPRLPEPDIVRNQQPKVMPSPPVMPPEPAIVTNPQPTVMPSPPPISNQQVAAPIVQQPNIIANPQPSIDAWRQAQQNPVAPPVQEPIIVTNPQPDAEAWRQAQQNPVAPPVRPLPEINSEFVEKIVTPVAPEVAEPTSPQVVPPAIEPPAPLPERILPEEVLETTNDGEEKESPYFEYPEFDESETNTSLSFLAEQIAELMKEKMPGYNPNDDAALQAMMNMYQRQGRRSTNNLLGQLAARSGGNISSYAAAAAGENMLDYTHKAQMLVPEYQNQFYNRQVDERKARMEAIASLLGINNEQYNRFLQDRNFELNLHNAAVAARLSEQEIEQAGKKLAYDIYRDSIEDDKWSQEFGLKTSMSDFDRKIEQEKVDLDRTYKQGVLSNQREATTASQNQVEEKDVTGQIAGFILDSPDPKSKLLLYMQNGMISFSDANSLLKMMDSLSVNEKSAVADELKKIVEDNR